MVAKTVLPNAGEIRRRMSRAKVSLPKLGRFYIGSAVRLAGQELTGEELVDLLTQEINDFLRGPPNLAGTYYETSMRANILKWVKAIVKELPNREQVIDDAKAACE